MQEEIKYGQLWARHSELVVADQVGNYRISFEGMKRAIEEVLRMQHPGSNVWVKALKQLPPTPGEYHSKKHGKRFVMLFADADRKMPKEYWEGVEWLNEANEQPVEQKENEAVDLIELIQYIRETYKPSKEVWKDKFGIALLSDEGVLSMFNEYQKQNKR